MIAKKIPAPNGHVGSFGDSVAYITQRHKADWVHLEGIAFQDTAPYEMEVQAARSKRCQDPVHHEVLSYAPDEMPTQSQIIDDVRRVLAARDMEGHQFISAAHRDTDNLHVHIVANRIGPDGLANSTSWENRNAERAVAEIAAERGWTIIVGKFNRDLVAQQRGVEEPIPAPRPRDQPDYQRVNRQGETPWPDAARPAVLAALDASTSWEGFRQNLAASGIALKHSVKRGKDGREFHGLSFAEGDAPKAPGCAASRIDSERCKYRALAERFGPYQEHGPEAAPVRSRATQKPAHSATDIADSKEAANGQRQTKRERLDAWSTAQAEAGGRRRDRNRAHERGRMRLEAERPRSTGIDRNASVRQRAELRAGYQEYRAACRLEVTTRRQAKDAAWSAERALRSVEGRIRAERRRAYRSLTFDTLRRGIMRSTVLLAFDVLDRRRAKLDHADAIKRWEATKERLRPTGPILDYRSWLQSTRSASDEQARSSPTDPERSRSDAGRARPPKAPEPPRRETINAEEARMAVSRDQAAPAAGRRREDPAARGGGLPDRPEHREATPARSGAAPDLQRLQTAIDAYANQQRRIETWADALQARSSAEAEHASLRATEERAGAAEVHALTRLERVFVQAGGVWQRLVAATTEFGRDQVIARLQQAPGDFGELLGKVGLFGASAERRAALDAVPTAAMAVDGALVAQGQIRDQAPRQEAAAAALRTTTDRLGELRAADYEPTVEQHRAQERHLEVIARLAARLSTDDRRQLASEQRAVFRLAAARYPNADPSRADRQQGSAEPAEAQRSAGRDPGSSAVAPAPGQAMELPNRVAEVRSAFAAYRKIDPGLWRLRQKAEMVIVTAAKGWSPEDDKALSPVEQAMLKQVCEAVEKRQKAPKGSDLGHKALKDPDLGR